MAAERGGDRAVRGQSYPLAAISYLFVQRATIRTTEPETFERSVDMIRKLRDTGDCVRPPDERNGLCGGSSAEADGFARSPRRPARTAHRAPVLTPVRLPTRGLGRAAGPRSR